MEHRSIFRNISPLDHRYLQSNRQLFEQLSEYLSEEAAVCYCARVEAALVKTHLEFEGALTDEAESAVDAAAEGLDPAEVYAEEERTHHNIRALVNVMQRSLPERLRPYLHRAATSVDVLDTAAAMRYRDALRRVVLPVLIAVVEELCRLSKQEADTPQVGRTHGRHAVPVTFGFALAEYLARLGKSTQRLHELSGDLRGKLSGAVGAYNALSLLYPDPLEFERRHLKRLGIHPSEYATQIVEPEYLLRVLFELSAAFGVIANLADDLRHLQRSEIDEVREQFGETQVGSSTMPQKRNPWNCEHIKSLWKAFAPRVVSFQMDQISEHQRDLSNSASGRFVGEFIAGAVAAGERMRRVLSGLQVDRERMRANLGMTGDMVLAEPAYIVLSAAGRADAHEIVRRLTVESEAKGRSVLELLQADTGLWRTLQAELKERSGIDAEAFFSSPQGYSGQAARRARELSDRYRKLMTRIKEALANEL